VFKITVDCFTSDFSYIYEMESFRCVVVTILYISAVKLCDCLLMLHVCHQLFEDVVSVLDPEMLELCRDSGDEMTASCSDVSSTERAAVADEPVTPDPQPEHGAEK